MPTSTSKLIADKIVAAIQAISGAPSLVEWRKTEAFFPNKPGGDPNTGIIVSGGTDTIFRRNMGPSADHEYKFQVAYFKSTTPDVTADDVNPELFESIKTVLSVTTFSGTPVWDFELVASSEWEKQPFAKGVEVSRLGVLYRTNEGD